MSTILDALRKLQRERTAAHPPRDLRGSVTDQIPVSRSRRRSNRAGIAIGAVVLLSAVAGGGAWLYRSGMLRRPGAAPSAPTPAARAVEPQAPAAEEHVATEEELAQAEREMDAATAATPDESAPAPVAAPPVPTPAPPANVEAEAAAERARLEAIQAQAAAAAAAQREAETQAAARARPPAPAPVPVPAPAATAAAQSPSAPPPAEMASPPRPAPPAASQPKARPKSKPSAKPAKRESHPSETARNDEPAPGRGEGAPDAQAQPLFPPVRVESIRWHPIAERRVASLRFEQQNVPDAHEGDIVAGVLVYRIDPGAVELRVGSTSRVIRPLP